MTVSSVVCRCRVRAVVEPMTSTEHQTGGFETESKYRLRLVGYSGVLGAQSQVDWQGKRYAIDGDPRIYNGSRRTAHVEMRDRAPIAAPAPVGYGI